MGQILQITRPNPHSLKPQKFLGNISLRWNSSPSVCSKLGNQSIVRIPRDSTDACATHIDYSFCITLRECVPQ